MKIQIQTSESQKIRRAQPPGQCAVKVARFCLWFGIILAGAQVEAGVMKIELPKETGSFKSAPGSDLANGQCLVCHSVEYVLMQPPMKQAFWAASVKKMREKFGAAIADDQVEPLVKYLTDSYGVPTNGAPATEVKAAPAATQPLTVEALATRNGCLACHSINAKIVGPAYKDVAAKYRTDPKAFDKIMAQIHNGGSGKWGPAIMPPFPTVTDAEAKMLAAWIMSAGETK